MTATAELIRIECACPTCETNAEHVGAPFPLAADAHTSWQAKIDAARPKARAELVHSLVWLAHDPVLAYSSQVRKYGPFPVR